MTNVHKIRHGDIVVNPYGTYRMYVLANPNDDVNLRCVSLSMDSVYNIDYKVGDNLDVGETFVCNTIDLCANNT